MKKKFFNTTFPKLGQDISQQDYISKVLTQPLARHILDLFLAAPKGVLSTKAIYVTEGLNDKAPANKDRQSPCPYRQIVFSLQRLAHAGIVSNNNKGKHSVYTLHPDTLRIYAKSIEALLPNN